MERRQEPVVREVCGSGQGDSDKQLSETKAVRRACMAMLEFGDVDDGDLPAVPQEEKK